MTQTITIKTARKEIENRWKNALIKKGEARKGSFAQIGETNLMHKLARSSVYLDVLQAIYDHPRTEDDTVAADIEDCSYYQKKINRSLAQIFGKGTRIQSREEYKEGEKCIQEKLIAD